MKRRGKNPREAYENLSDLPRTPSRAKVRIFTWPWWNSPENNTRFHFTDRNTEGNVCLQISDISWQW